MDLNMDIFLLWAGTSVITFVAAEVWWSAMINARPVQIISAFDRLHENDSSLFFREVTQHS